MAETIADTEQADERPKVKIQFKGGVAGKRSGAHGSYRWSFAGKGPFVVYEQDYRDHLERTGLFEIAPEKPPAPRPQGQQVGAGQSGGANNGGDEKKS